VVHPPPSILVAFVFKNLQNPFLVTRAVSHLYKTPGCHPSPSQKNSNRSLATSQLVVCCIYLPPLALSLRSFSSPHPLFSAIYGLFLQNTGGWGWVTSRVYPTRRHATRFALVPSRCYHELMRLKNLCIVLLCLLPAATPAQTADEILAKNNRRTGRPRQTPCRPFRAHLRNNFLRRCQRPLRRRTQTSPQNAHAAHRAKPDHGTRL